ncbi:MAG: type I DNA topoisomerase [Rhodobiaceae bacterium]|nr:type I DNA topoisomerase [Rhodobiaceae bacterium]
MDIVIVESPAKAKTINKYLGPGFQVVASYGHVRDLPAKDGSVRPDEDFAMSWDLDAKSQKRINDIARAVKGADRLILATDPDREGEAISWHVLEVLKQKNVLKDIKVDRVVFNAITKKAVLDAMAQPRQIDEPLVEAYLARRALDYLVGFTLSPVLWRKLPGARSAGRVQSVALRLICDRELEIETFIRQEYWSIVATLQSSQGAAFEARLVGADGKKVGKLDIADEASATAIRKAIESGTFSVADVATKPQKRHPYPPFTTSTLQQEASRKLGFSATRTMQIAQRLYEGVEMNGDTQGLITYMRTDGVQMAPEAVQACRSVIARDFGDRYLPPAPRLYKTKAKNAQEAHEAIRPTDPARRPADVARHLDSDQARLYELIWKRTMASQMESAELARTTIEISGKGSDHKPYELRATGTVTVFDGFLSLYQEGRDEEEDEDNAVLPAVKAGEATPVASVAATQHSTEPPPRYTEATMIKRMEELGIGRPSTYTQTLSTLRDREYVRLDKKRLIPEDKGRLVTAFLESFFHRYVEYDFTADLEERLDQVSRGELAWRTLLHDFWNQFTQSVDDIKDLRVSQVLDALNELLGPHIFPSTGEGDARACPSCGEGRLSLKVGKFGAFVGCSNYPECRFTRQLTANGEGEAGAPVESGDRLLGIDPETEREVWLKTGRFGPYFERPGEEGEKPARASVPKDIGAAEPDLALALRLLSLPREIGLHPESGKPISAGIGRYGPFVLHDGQFANLENTEEVFTVGLNRAVTLLAERKERNGRRAPQTLKDLGEHPTLGGPMQVLSGRYGPYIKHGKINATLPRAMKPEEVTPEQAVTLIAEKMEKGGARKTSRAKAGTKPKAKAKPKAKTAAKQGKSGQAG